MQPGDAEHGGVNAVAFQTAVAKDLPGLHPREEVLDAGPDLAVGGVVLLLPSWQRGPADSGLRTGQFPRLASLRLPVTGRPTTMSRVSASMTTWPGSGPAPP